MRLGIVNRFTHPYYMRYLIGDALTQLGHEWLPIDYRNLSLQGGLVYHNATDVSELGLDAALWRISENELPAAQPLIEALARQVYLVNTPRAIELCANKWLTHERLQLCGVPCVPTMLAQPGMVAPVAWDPKWAEDFDLSQTVYKPIHGAGGNGVRIMDLGETVVGDEPAILQPLARVPGADHLRVQVSGERVTGAIHRVPDAGQFANNVALGGQVRAAEVTDQVKQVALAAAAGMGARIAGVDMIPSVNGAGVYVLEVNSTPGVQGLLDLEYPAAEDIAWTFVAAAKLALAASST